MPRKKPQTYKAKIMSYLGLDNPERAKGVASGVLLTAAAGFALVAACSPGKEISDHAKFIETYASKASYSTRELVFHEGDPTDPTLTLFARFDPKGIRRGPTVSLAMMRYTTDSTIEATVTDYQNNNRSSEPSYDVGSITEQKKNGDSKKIELHADKLTAVAEDLWKEVSSRQNATNADENAEVDRLRAVLKGE